MHCRLTCARFIFWIFPQNCFTHSLLFLFSLFLKIIQIVTFVICWFIYLYPCVPGLEGNLLESVLSLYSVASRYWTQGARLGSKPLYLLSLSFWPLFAFLISHQFLGNSDTKGNPESAPEEQTSVADVWTEGGSVMGPWELESPQEMPSLELKWPTPKVLMPGLITGAHS